MAIPSSGKVSIGDIRTELQNGGTSNFSLTLAGRPTTGVPGTFGNPIYTPINQSSSFIPNNNSPYSIAEWAGYNHTQNAFCDNKDLYIVTGYPFNQTGKLYSYEPAKNTLTLLDDSFTEVLFEDYGITERGIVFQDGDLDFYYTVVSWTPYQVLKYEHIVSDGRASSVYGMFAKDINKMVGWGTSSTVSNVNYYPIYEVEFSYDPIQNEASGNSVVSTLLFKIAAASYQVYGGLFYLGNKYYLSYSTGGGGFSSPIVGPHFVGRFTADGGVGYVTPERSVPVDNPIDDIYYYEGNFYGVSSNIEFGNINLNNGTSSIYLLDFVGQTSSLFATMPVQTFNSIGQVNYNNPNGFTTSQLGPYYSYYRVGLQGETASQSLITVSGTGTLGHFCYIYTSYPFNDVGQPTGAAWTYSRFESDSVKYFTRTMTSENEVLHFVMFEDMN